MREEWSDYKLEIIPEGLSQEDRFDRLVEVIAEQLGEPPLVKSISRNYRRKISGIDKYWLVQVGPFIIEGSTIEEVLTLVEKELGIEDI